MENKTAKDANYDRGITSAETAARMEREGENFKKLPDNEENTDATAGYTVDREGLANNYAIEPEMYYEVPGDRAADKAKEKEQRVEEMKDINTPGGKGVGMI
ncbi:hypothetical protein Xen7305DRAFT_00038630 [Xenococcus sp. PCC 7305]|uniref:hypothetical protein n=1 Tax=Xenococcus sp. PCC 7305 TaxID=102125 RepID=UPI0002ACFD9F|nr:hypothetical protein [Xenococcus sp. PCC 7305]ELS04135.1 hypothetical protein Xen7305DRAFT_00038630 [Xenococcus sp. PCC 7305]